MTTQADKDKAAKILDEHCFAYNTYSDEKNLVRRIDLFADALAQARAEEREKAARISESNNDKCDNKECNKRFNIAVAIRNSKPCQSPYL